MRSIISSITESAQQRFDPVPASVSRARRFVVATLDTWGLRELGDTAELLVSEVVTNAVLHGGTTVTVVVQRSGDVVRCEVLDGSSASPALRTYDVDAATGRGLELVAALATEWGVTTVPPGKSVWFQVGGDDAADQSAMSNGNQRASAAPVRQVSLVGAPIALLWITIQHGDALLREATLLALGGETEIAERQTWTGPTLDLTTILESLKQARDADVQTTDLELTVVDGAGDGALRRLALVEEADRLAAEGLLLSVPSLPEVAACRRWFLGEVARQLAGESAERWTLPPPELRPGDTSVTVAQHHRERLARESAATVAADASNHIVSVNSAAAELLGWKPEDLVGQRLTVIIPPRLRESHLASFTHYQIMGESRILGTTVSVPALRRDGTEVLVDLTIEEWLHGGRSLFVARFDGTK